MKIISNFLILIISVIILSGCVSNYGLQLTTKNEVLKKTYAVQEIYNKTKECYESSSIKVILEQPVNKNYQKIRIYEHPSNFYRLIAVITIFNDKEQSIYVTEKVSKGLNISNWIKNNLECKK